MRGRLIIAALLALALHGCGSGESNDSSGSPGNAQQQQVAGPAAGTSAGGKAAAQAAVGESGSTEKPDGADADAGIAPAPAASTFVPSAKGGGAPAVLFVHDLAGGEGDALDEAKGLAGKGVASMVLHGAYGPTQDPAEFAAQVAELRATLAELRKRPGVDPNRIALVGEGTGARVAAVVLGQERGALRGAVLADLGAAGGGIGRFAPQRWLSKARPSLVMLQRSTALDRTTDEQLQQLLLAAPPGTLVHDYKKLDAKARAERDTWLRKVLE
jgi:dienelactone hydrolase